MLTKCYWLDTSDGRVMIGHWAVLIGRSPDCNIVLEGAGISRHHLLVRAGSAGAEMLPLGRTPVLLNGVERRALTPLRAGDRIEVGGRSFRLREGEVETGAQGDEAAWFLEGRTGLLHLITAPLFRVGGGLADDLIVEGWEPTTLSISRGADGPVLTATRPGVRCGRDLGAGESVPLVDGARITFRDEALVARARPARAGDETQGAQPPKSAVVVLLEFMPKGGQLTIEIDGRLHTTALPERRCDMVACLLQPPAPFVAGDFIPEETVCARVWPGGKGGRTELNYLLYRLRQALAEEGIDPAPLFERRGGGLRFCLAPRARVVVR